MKNSLDRSKIASITIIAMSAVLSAIILIFVFSMFRVIVKEPKVVVIADRFEIQSMYGGTYKLSDITELTLKDALPAVLRKTNGANLRDIKKGFFDVKGFGNCRLILQADKTGPFLFIKVNGKYIIINFKDPQKTKKLYESMLKNSKI